MRSIEILFEHSREKVMVGETLVVGDALLELFLDLISEHGSEFASVEIEAGMPYEIIRYYSFFVVLEKLEPRPVAVAGWGALKKGQLDASYYIALLYQDEKEAEKLRAVIMTTKRDDQVRKLCQRCIEKLPDRLKIVGQYKNQVFPV